MLGDDRGLDHGLGDAARGQQALDLGGARVFALGRLPAAGSDELKRRGKPLRFVPILRLQSVGQIAKPVIEAAILAEHPAFLAWEQALAKKPEAEGTVHVQVFITPAGSVGSSSGSGVDADTSACFAKVIRGLTFPKPGGGGGAQVNVPFLLRGGA